MKHLTILLTAIMSLSFLHSNGKDIPFINKEVNQLCFHENVGQVRDQYGHERKDIDFVAHAPGMSVFIGNGKIEYQYFHITDQTASSVHHADVPEKHAVPLSQQTNMYRMEAALTGSFMHATVVKEDKKGSVFNYADPDAHTTRRSESYGRIIYKNVYPHIDWVVSSGSTGIKYEFLVHPGGDPSAIKIKYNGATSLRLEPDGSLMAVNPLGSIREDKPLCFQEDGSPVTSSFVLHNNVLGFRLAAYKGDLVIDPSIDWSTYFGGIGHERYTDIITDDYGFLYACGYTSSLTDIATTGAYQTSFAGVFDGVVTKFDTLGAVIWSTYYGGATQEYLFAISTTGTSVYTAGDKVDNNDHDALLVKFDSSGQMIWNHTYGAFGYDQLETVINDPWGNIYTAGTTESPGMATAGAFQTTQGQNGDAFLMKVDPAGNTIWSTYYGDAGFEEFDDLRLDAAGNIIGVGGSLSGNLNTMPPAYAGALDAMLFSFDTAGVRLWCRYFGGPGGDYPYALGLDAAGNMFVSGTTNSTTGIAAGPSPYQSVMTGFPVSDGYLAKFDNTGQTLWATYFGGYAYEMPSSLEVTAGGDVFFGGNTASIAGISYGNAMQPGYGGGTQDGFLALFTGSGTNVWSTYFGGNDYENIFSVTLDNAGNMYAAGYSESSSGIATPLSHQPFYNGNGDAFLVKLTTACTPLSTPSSITGPASLCAGSSAVYSITPVSGASTYTWTSPSGFTGSSNTSSISLTAGNTGGSISVTASNGCGTTVPSSLSITVNASVTASISPVTNPAFCQGDSLILQAASTGAGYQWLLNGAPIAGSVADSLHVHDAGDYSLVADPGGACSDTSAAVSIAVNAPITTSISPVSNPAFCQGDSLILYAASTGAGYQWLLNGAPIAGSVTDSLHVHDAGDYSLVVDPGSLCFDTSATLSITVNASVTSSISPVSNPAFCQGDSLILQAASVFNGYQWLFNGTPITGSVADSLHVHNGGDYSLVANPGSACSDTSAALSITVNPQPAAPVATNDGPACSGGNIQLSASGNAGSFSWTGPNGYSSSVQNPAITNVTTSDVGAYTVTVTIAGCISASSAPTSVTLALPPQMPGPITGGQTICLGSVEVYSTPNDPLVTSYTWTLPTGWSGTSNTNSISVTPGSSSGLIAVTASNICGQSAVQSVAVVSLAPPTVSITATGNLLSTTGIYDTYQWYFNGSPIPGATGQAYNVSLTGNYYLIVTNTVCTAQSNILSMITGIATVPAPDETDLYPNPNHGTFTLSSRLTEAGIPATITIFNAYGQAVYKKTVTPSNSQSGISVDSGSLSSGIYLIKIEVTDRQIVKPFVVE